MNHGYKIWSATILRPDFILRDQDRKWKIQHWPQSCKFEESILLSFRLKYPYNIQNIANISQNCIPNHTHILSLQGKNIIHKILSQHNTMLRVAIYDLIG